MLSPWDIEERPMEIIGISSVMSKAVSVSTLCIKLEGGGKGEDQSGR